MALASRSSTSSGEISGAWVLGLKDDEGKGEESHFCQEREQTEGEWDTSSRLSATTPDYSLLRAATSWKASLTVLPPMLAMACRTLWISPERVLPVGAQGMYCFDEGLFMVL